MYPKTVFFTILGLLVASPFSIIYATCNEYTISFDFWTIFFSIISFVFGLGLVIFGEYMSNKTRIENKE
jgi:hypothetical protein